MTYSTELLAQTEIKERLSTAGCNSKVTVHSDQQGENTVTRTVVFKTVVALADSESIINKMCDIGTETDRGIAYRGSQVEPGDGGEMRILFFEAKINPFN
jgi:hypothetical protein